jgi:hypothetical protein
MIVNVFFNTAMVGNPKACLTITVNGFVIQLWWGIEQFTLKNVNSCWNAKFYFYLETCDGQNSNQYLNVVHFFYASYN